MPYCPNCGAQVQQGSKFCSSCGNPLQGTPVPPARPVQTGEQVYATMSGLTKGLLGRDNYVLLVTSQRLMFVKLDGDDRNMISQAIMEQAKSEDKGLLGRLAAGIGASYNIGDYFLGWSLQQVASRFNDVFSVSASDVRELRIRTMDPEYGNQYELRIKSTGYNEKFRLSRVEKEEHQALKTLLGNRFKSNQWFL